MNRQSWCFWMTAAAGGLFGALGAVAIGPVTTYSGSAAVLLFTMIVVSRHDIKEALSARKAR